MAVRSHDPEVGTSAWQRISRALDDEIRRGYRGGEFLPSEQILASRFGVNRHTLRRAVDELVEAGLVQRRRGRGTVVLDAQVVYPIHARTRFTTTLEALGRAADSVVCERKLIPASRGVAAALDLREGREVVWLEVLRLVDGQPFGVVSSFLPAPRYADLIDCYQGGSLHACLAERHRLDLRRRWSRITAVMPRTEDAHRLRCPRNRSLLRIKSLNVAAASGEPVEYCVTRMRSDRVQLEVTP